MIIQKSVYIITKVYWYLSTKGGSLVMKEYFYKRIDNSETLEELNSTPNPNKGDVSYVNEKGYDYRFNGKKWVKVSLVSNTLAGWTLAATSLLICLT